VCRTAGKRKGRGVKGGWVEAVCACDEQCRAWGASWLLLRLWCSVPGNKVLKRASYGRTVGYDGLLTRVEYGCFGCTDSLILH